MVLLIASARMFAADPQGQSGDGPSLSGATVILRGSAEERRAATTIGGRYLFPALPSGAYNLRIEACRERSKAAARSTRIPPRSGYVLKHGTAPGKLLRKVL